MSNSLTKQICCERLQKDETTDDKRAHTHTQVFSCTARPHVWITDKSDVIVQALRGLSVGQGAPPSPRAALLLCRNKQCIQSITLAAWPPLDPCLLHSSSLLHHLQPLQPLSPTLHACVPVSMPKYPPPPSRRLQRCICSLRFSSIVIPS